MFTPNCCIKSKDIFHLDSWKGSFHPGVSDRPGYTAGPGCSTSLMTGLKQCTPYTYRISQSDPHPEWGHMH